MTPNIKGEGKRGTLKKRRRRLCSRRDFSEWEVLLGKKGNPIPFDPGKRKAKHLS